MMYWRHIAASAAAPLEDWRYLAAVVALLLLTLLRAWLRGYTSTRSSRNRHAAASQSSRSAWDLKVVRLVGALTRDEQRSRQCLETQRLARDDAKDIPGYLTHPLPEDATTAEE